MARASSESRVARVSSLLRRRADAANSRERQRLEEKFRAAADASAQWRVLLRDMEENGETHEGRYDRYYQAYLQAKQLEKRIDVELFNLREGLVR